MRDYWFILIFVVHNVRICILSYGYGMTSVGSRQPCSAFDGKLRLTDVENKDRIDLLERLKGTTESK